MGKSVDEIGKLLHEYEEKQFSIYKRYKVYGFLGWQIIKRPLFYSLIRESFVFDNEKKGKKAPVLKYLIALVAFPFKLAFLKIKKPKLQALVIGHENYKFEKNSEGKDINNYADHWYLACDKNKVVYIEHKLGIKSELNGAIPIDIDISFLSPVIRLVTKLWLKVVPAGKLSTDLSKDLVQFSKEEDGSTEQYIFKTRTIISKFKLEYFFFLLFFKVLRPRVLVITDAVGTGAMAAAKRVGVTVIENQHGHFDRYKPDYMMNKRTVGTLRNELVLPDHVAVFGQYFKNFLLGSSIWTEEEIVPVGNIRIDMYRNEKKKADAFTILIPTQWTMLKDTIALLDIITAIEWAQPIEVCIKLHPREPQDHITAYKQYVTKYSYIKLAGNERSIYDLFTKTDLLIGFYSTALYEAVALEIPVVTIATEKYPQGIHTFVNPDQVLQKVIKVYEVDALYSLLLDCINQSDFWTKWVEDVKNGSNYLYTIGCETNSRKLLERYTS